MMKTNYENEINLLRKNYKKLEEDISKYKRNRMQDQITIINLKKELKSFQQY